MLSASLSVYIKALPLETCLIFLHSKALILMNVMVDFLHDMAGKSEHIPTAVCQLSIHVFSVLCYSQWCVSLLRHGATLSLELLGLIVFFKFGHL